MQAGRGELRRISRTMPSFDLLFAPLALLLAALAVGAATARHGAQPEASAHSGHRGLGFWQLAQGLACAGATLVALAPPPAPGAWLAQACFALWPVLWLAGWRRFQGRGVGPDPLNPGLAAGMASATGAGRVPGVGGVGAVGGAGLARWPTWATLAALGALLLPALWPESPAAIGPAAVASVALHLAVAVPLFQSSAGRAGTPLAALGAAVALAGLLPVLAMLPSADAAVWLQAQALATGLGGLVSAFVVLTLLYERTEQQLRASRRRLRVLANLDPLTQLPNRRHFQHLAQRALQADPPGSAVLLIFDIDHFKRINDHLGHAAGDRALCLVSTSLLDMLRSRDLAGRHGGDEFVLLLRQAGPRQAIGVAARIVEQVQRQAGAQGLPALSLSFGVVQVAPGEALPEALRRADQALYEAKRQGRSRAVAAVGDEQRPVFSESQRLGLTPC